MAQINSGRQYDGRLCYLAHRAVRQTTRKHGNNDGAAPNLIINDRPEKPGPAEWNTRDA
jgi:hypothetical protein